MQRIKLGLLLLLLLFTSRTTFAAGNLITNGDLETGSQSPTGWNKGGWGSNTAVLTYPTEGDSGSRGITVEISNYSSGDAKWYPNEVAVTPGKEYRVVDSYWSSGNSEFEVRVSLSDGTKKYISLAKLAATNSWTSISKTTVMPANSVSATIFHLLYSNGKLITDNYQLSEVETITPTPTTIPTSAPSPTIVPTILPTLSPTPSPTRTPTPTLTPTTTPTAVPTATPTVTSTVTPTPIETNLIANGNLESGTSGSPANWLKSRWGTNTTSFSYPVSGYQSNRAAMVEVSKYTSGDAKWFFQDVGVQPGESYVFSDYFQSNTETEIDIRWYNQATGSYSYKYIGTYPAATDWTKREIKFTAPANVTKVTVFHLLDSVGYLKIDEARLTKAKLFSRAQISLDFDDGYLSVWDNALPILNQAGYRATFYIVANYTNDYMGYMNRSQVVQLKNYGEVQSHSRSHAHLTTLTPVQLTSEVVGSKSDLAAMGISTSVFAYPYGEFNETVMNQVRSAGYAGSRLAGGNSGYNYPGDDPYWIKSKTIEVTTTTATIKSWIDEAVANKLWLILLMHEISNNGNQYSLPPARLQEIVNYIKTQDVEVITASEGLSKL